MEEGEPKLVEFSLENAINTLAKGAEKAEKMIQHYANLKITYDEFKATSHKYAALQESLGQATGNENQSFGKEHILEQLDTYKNQIEPLFERKSKKQINKFLKVCKQFIKKYNSAKGNLQKMQQYTAKLNTLIEENKVPAQILYKS